MQPATARTPRRPGASTRKVLDGLRRYECPNVTFLAEDGSWPIVWERAQGSRVWDVEGRRYLDLTAAFGVAACGHANPRVVRAASRQMRGLLHAMGDVHPHPGKARLARTLSQLTFERWCGAEARTLFCNSGFEAVEAALKTALLATGRRQVIAFEGAYHGLGHGALNVTHRDLFRRPFLGQLAQFGEFLPYPESQADLSNLRPKLGELLRRRRPGAVLVEPVQARGGIRVPPPGFLQLLREQCSGVGALLITDEIYTGMARTGRWFACEHEGVVPDITCLGKALTGGFPLSACVGRSDVMEAAWPRSEGEAMHTSTFLGHPVGCAMALAQIREINERHLVERCRKSGLRLLQALGEVGRGFKRLRCEARGLGLMAGIELRHRDGRPAGPEALAVTQRMLESGFILLPEGSHGQVISLTPPLTTSWTDLQRAASRLAAESALVDRACERKAGA